MSDIHIVSGKKTIVLSLYTALLSLIKHDDKVVVYYTVKGNSNIFCNKLKSIFDGEVYIHIFDFNRNSNTAEVIKDNDDKINGFVIKDTPNKMLSDLVDDNPMYQDVIQYIVNNKTCVEFCVIKNAYDTQLHISNLSRYIKDLMEAKQFSDIDVKNYQVDINNVISSIKITLGMRSYGDCIIINEPNLRSHDCEMICNAIDKNIKYEH